MTKANLWRDVKWVGLPAVEADNAVFGSGRHIETALFRHVFEVPESAEMPMDTFALPFSISASGRYKLWVNGQCAMYGPCRSGRWEKHYETLDLASWLHPGTNVLAVRVVAYPPHEAQRGNHRAPFGFYGNGAGPVFVCSGRLTAKHPRKADASAGPGALSAEVPGGILSTGIADWQVMRDPSLDWDASTSTFWMGANEAVDLSCEPMGWMTGNFLDGWMQAESRWQVEPNGYGEMLPFPLSERPIPLPYMAPGRFVREMPLGKEDGEAFSFGLPAADLTVDWVSETLSAAKMDTVSAGFRLDASGCLATGEVPGETGTIIIPPQSKRTVVLDAGFLTTAFLRIPMREGAGSRLSITCAEAYTVPGEGRRPARRVRDDAENGWISGTTDTVVASGRDQIYEPFLFRTFRFVRIRVETADMPLTLALPSYVETGYPLVCEGTFRSAQTWTDSILDMSARTLARCMQETYTDCPYYEQLQYTMDTRLQMLFTYAASGDDRLARKAISDFHASLLPEGMLQSRWPSDLPQVIPGFSLHWIFMLEEHWIQTGSHALFRRYRPTVDAVLDWFEHKTDENGLAAFLGHWEYADWVREWESGAGVPPAAKTGPSTILNLTLAAALQSAARGMRDTGREEVAREYEARCDRIHEAVERLCWSEETGMYREGPKAGDFSQHAQVWAVLGGLAAGDRARLVLRNALSSPLAARCSFPWMFLLFRALEMADLYGETVSLWSLWQSLIPQRLTTVPEIPFDTRSDCHAWGALPLYEFPRSGLGVAPAEPGWASIRIAPKMLFLGEASGVAVTPRGPVEVDWQWKDGDFHLQCALPEVAAAEIRMPDGSVHLIPENAPRTQTFTCSWPAPVR